MKILLMLFTLLFFACTAASNNDSDAGDEANAENGQAGTSFYDFTLNDIDGNEIDFNQYRGKKVLVVNVASKCGYTPQYAELQELNEKYGDKVAILGFPANNFGGQEPGTNEEIKKFCTESYGVTFQMFDKVSVKGADKHPLFRWLSDKSLNGWNDKEPTWNFCKYFIDENGELKQFFPSSVKPMDDEIVNLIQS